MALNYVNLPLFTESDYEYTVVLERTAFKIRLFYIEREQRWAMDLRLSDRTPIVLGAALVASYPMFLDYYIEQLTGIFWLEPIGRSDNQTNENPFQLNEYFRFFYYYDDGEDE
jgi:hypothetical protein